jgi:imidazolonepropionase-like amidohydrolase
MRQQWKIYALIPILAAYLLTVWSPPACGRRQDKLGTKTYELKDGRWFDGRAFRKRTFYSVSGRLTTHRPPHIDEVLDLHGGFVVPPFADAHCHHFDALYNVDQQVNMYLRDGVFYAAVQTDVRSGALEVASKVNQPTSVDVSYAHGALTSSYGHGVEIYEGLALFRRTGGADAEEVKKLRASHLRENDAYYIIDSSNDLMRKWPTILAGQPDFIKIYLLTSEEYEERKIRTDTVGDRGLDPKLVPTIVDKAHAAGLRVSAHVDTVTDYRIALRANIDEMAHLPGYYIGLDDNPRKYELTERDARETAKRGTWVIVAPVFYDTFNPRSASYNPQVAARTDAVRVHNLKLLLKHGVHLAFGSDRYGNTPVDDVVYLQRLGIFTNLEILKIWCEATPQAIFPKRKIGYLSEGYEASFLLLNGNPLEGFSNIKSIRLRFKQGFPIMLPASPSSQ